MKSLLLSSALCLLISSFAGAQSIEVGELGSAQAYEPGVLQLGSGGLSSNLWSGTSATTAEALVDRLPQAYRHDVARSLARSALLSAGVPPNGSETGNFQRERLDAVLRLSDPGAAQDIARRTPELSGSRTLEADMALLAGDLNGACALSDSVIEARSDPYWMKLRAFCHVVRGEEAAADVTMDLLRNSGERDQGFEQIMRHLTGAPGRPDAGLIDGSPLTIAAMSKAGLSWPSGNRPPVAAAQSAYNAAADANTRLNDLFGAGYALSDNQLVEIIESLGEKTSAEMSDMAGGFAGFPPEANLDTALADKSAKGFHQLFSLARSGGIERLPALVEILKRAESKGALARFTDLMEAELLTMSLTELRREDIPLIAKTAIMRGDLGTLQQLHTSLGDNEAAQDRIALTADALGNGFYAGSLGTDIDGRLEKPGAKARAFRDALLAHALGADLSDPALRVLESKKLLGRLSGDMIALQGAARRGSQAETALRAALLLEEAPQSNLPDTTLFVVIGALYQAGLTEQAAQLAAMDFISDFPN